MTAPWRRASKPSPLAVELGDSALQVQASYRLGQAYYAIGDFGRAAELLWRNVAGVRTAESGTPSTDLLDRVPGVAGADLERARSLRRGPASWRGGAPPRHDGRPREHTNQSAHALARATCTLVKGDLEQAIRVFEPGLALCRASGNPGLVSRWIAAALGSAYAL